MPPEQRKMMEGLMKGAEKVSEICAVNPKAIDITPADLAVVKQLADLRRGAIPASAFLAPDGFRREAGMGK